MEYCSGDIDTRIAEARGITVSRLIEMRNAGVYSRNAETRDDEDIRIKAAALRLRMEFDAV